MHKLQRRGITAKQILQVYVYTASRGMEIQLKYEYSMCCTLPKCIRSLISRRIVILRQSILYKIHMPHRSHPERQKID